MPHLHSQLGSEAAFNFNKDYETDVESLFESQNTLLNYSFDKESSLR